MPDVFSELFCLQAVSTFPALARHRSHTQREVKAALMLPPGQRGPWLVHVSSVLSGHFSVFKKLQWVTVYTVMDHIKMKIKKCVFKQNFPCSGSPYVLWSLSTTCFLHAVVFLPHRLFFHTQVCCHSGLRATAAPVPRPLRLPRQVASDSTGPAALQRGQPQHRGPAEESSAA